MGKESETDTMSVLDAVNNLSGIAEVDIESDYDAFAQRSVKEDLQRLRFMEQASRQRALDTVRGSFKTIHKYLRNVYGQGKEHLKNPEMRRGVKAIMVLAGEAADKLDKYTTLFQHTYKEGKIHDIREYNDLKKFYVDKIVKRFREVLESEEEWEKEWGGEETTVNIERLGLKDLETVKRDGKYELFYIKKDNGQPFFNRNLLRHIKLVSDFDEIVSVSAEEDPLLHINILVDKEAEGIAGEIRKKVMPELRTFYKHAKGCHDVFVIRSINKAVMALSLAADPDRFRSKSGGKTSTRYLYDFQLFLREVLLSPAYLRLVEQSPEETDTLSKSFLELAHAFCFALLTRVGEKTACIAYIERLIKRGYGRQKATRGKTIAPVTFWNDLLDSHESVTRVLRKYPGGPLFKTLDVFHNKDSDSGFDPLYQGNRPSVQFTMQCHLSDDALSMQCVRLPCPTIHKFIGKAEVIGEFKGYLRRLIAEKGGPHLLFNLQDRISWEEQARCQALEEYAKRAEFTDRFILVTLPKRSDFYFQNDVYREMDRADEFLRVVKQRIIKNEGSGFFFSRKIPAKKLNVFIDQLLPIIHKKVFHSRKILTYHDRLNFIEILYQFLMLKVIDLVKPSYFSFTCKDAVDIGPVTGAGFYAMLKMMSGHVEYEKEEREHLLWMLHAPSLLLRERLVDYGKLNRMISAISCLHEGIHKDKRNFFKEIAPLFSDVQPQRTEITFN
ncbi:MAG: hypothetical protein OXF02_02550 [Simkaniaceae bacterium]|nr:hypothetical protein [Simkaniaceae bacterium]